MGITRKEIQIPTRTPDGLAAGLAVGLASQDLKPKPPETKQRSSKPWTGPWLDHGGRPASDDWGHRAPCER